MERVVKREIKKMEMRFQIGMAIAGCFFNLCVFFLYIHAYKYAIASFILTLIQGSNALVYLDIKNELKDKFTFGR